MTRIKFLLPTVAVLACGLAQSATSLLGPELSSFAVLGAAAVTNAGATSLSGDLGVSSNASATGITGFFGTLADEGPGMASGLVHQGDAYALLADAQLLGAMDSLGLLGTGIELDADLAGLTLAPGVYTVAAGASNLSGTLVLDGGGNANAYWVFQMPTGLITSADSSVDIIGTGSGSGVYWNVGSSATLGAGTEFLGNILAGASITMNPGVDLGCGRALAHTGAITLSGNTIDAIGCQGTLVSGSHGLSGGLTVSEIGGTPSALAYSPVSAVPEPAGYALMLAGLGWIGAVLAKRRRLDR
jgi:hypothetical protein